MNDGWELVAMNARAEVERLRARGTKAVHVGNGHWVWGTSEALAQLGDVEAQRDRLLAAIASHDNGEAGLIVWAGAIAAAVAEVRAEMEDR